MGEYAEVKIYLQVLDLCVKIADLSRNQSPVPATPLRVATPPIPVYVPVKEEKK